MNKYDYSHRGYFSIVKKFRLILLQNQKIFFITYLIQKYFSNKNWERRRILIEAEVFIKMLFPILGLFLINMMSNIVVNYVILVFILGTMVETIMYVLRLIFLADIQNPSANIYRSIILLFENSIQLIFGFAFLYNFSGVIKDSSIIKCICFAFTRNNADIINNTGFILSSIQSSVSFIFVGLIFAYFVSNFKQLKFSNDK